MSQHPIPDAYWVEEGKLVLGPAPADPDRQKQKKKMQALLDAGVDREWLRGLPGRLGLGAIEVDITQVKRCSVSATKVDFRFAADETAGNRGGRLEPCGGTRSPHAGRGCGYGPRGWCYASRAGTTALIGWDLTRGNRGAIQYRRWVALPAVSGDISNLD